MRKRMLRTEDVDRAADLLSRATEVALVCHVNPDADAIGSMLGLAYLVAPKDLPKSPPVLVCLGAADLGRLDGLAHLVEKAGTTICIDHHRTNKGFAAINLIDPEASATAE